MLRYELNTIFNYHQFEEEGEKEQQNFFMGPYPLSKDRKTGQQIRDLDENGKLKNLDKFRPPGLIRIKETSKYSTALKENTKLDAQARYNAQFQKETSSIPVYYDVKGDEADKVERIIWNGMPSK